MASRHRCVLRGDLKEEHEVALGTCQGRPARSSKAKGRSALDEYGWIGIWPCPETVRLRSWGAGGTQLGRAATFSPCFLAILEAPGWPPLRDTGCWIRRLPLAALLDLPDPLTGWEHAWPLQCMQERLEG